MEIQKKIIAVAVVILWMFAGCASQLPTPTQSDYLKTRIGNYSIERETRAVSYFMIYDVIKPIEKKISLMFLFENPVDSRAPLVAEGSLVPGQTEIEIESRKLPAIQNGATYRVTVIGSDPDTAQEIFRHDQYMVFVMPPGI